MTKDSGSPGPDLLMLALRLSGAKRRKEQAAAEVLAIEVEILQATGFVKPEGQQTFPADDDRGSCSVTLKQPINTKVDSDAWPALRRTLPKDHPGRGVFRTKYEIDAKAARALQDGDDAAKKAWAEVSKVITRTPGKVAVELNSLEVRAAMPDPAPDVEGR